MADTKRIRLWLDEKKTWLVKLWFQIPELYVMSVEEESKLFNYIITERENSYAPRYLGCKAMCDGTLCFFCSEVSESCKSYSAATRAQ